MFRSAWNQLRTWQQSKHRKPLIILGARQVGKTYLVENYGASAFSQVHTFNFERQPRAASIFEQDLNPARILNELSLISGKRISPIDDLLFLDEIQAAPKALTSLRHFCVQMPQLAVCAAGSLLGIHLSEGSFPVGSVDWLHLYPMSFSEFIDARANIPVREAFAEARTGSPISLTAHRIFWELWREYLVTGGMPEVISRYLLQSPGSLEGFTEVRGIQLKIINAYLAEVAKHAGKINALHIERTWNAVPRQLALAQDLSVSRFKFKDVVPGVHNFGRLAGAIDWLAKAGLILTTSICERAEIPLASFTKTNIFKIYMFDVGLLGAMIELPPASLVSFEFGMYKGYIAENFVAQALKLSRPESSFFGWSEGKSEIEFLIQGTNSATPIEVKSSTRVRAQSLRAFNEKYSPKYSVILSGREFKVTTQKKTAGNSEQIHVQLPLYLAERAWDYLD